MIIGVNGSAGGGGSDVSVTLEPGTLSQTFANLAPGATNILAGAYEIRLYNAGLENITANGVTVFPGETWTISARENFVTQKLDFCPLVAVVVPAGGAASYQAEYPSV